MSEIDDRNFALAEKSLASLRNHRRAGAAAHPDKLSSSPFAEIGRSLSSAECPLSSSTVYDDALVPTHASRLSLSLFLSPYSR